MDEIVFQKTIKNPLKKDLNDSERLKMIGWFVMAMEAVSDEKNDPLLKARREFRELNGSTLVESNAVFDWLYLIGGFAT